jgi:hypothetical protein
MNDPSKLMQTTDHPFGLYLQMKINQLTRKLGKKFFAASSVGIHGWVFADLLQHDFVM